MMNFSASKVTKIHLKITRPLPAIELERSKSDYLRPFLIICYIFREEHDGDINFC